MRVPRAGGGKHLISVEYMNRVERWLDANNARCIREDWDRASRARYKHFCVNGALVVIFSTLNAYEVLGVPVETNDIEESMRALDTYIGKVQS